MIRVGQIDLVTAWVYALLQNIFSRVGFSSCAFFLKNRKMRKIYFYVNFSISYSHLSVDAAPQRKLEWLGCTAGCISSPSLCCMVRICVYLYQPINSTLALDCLFPHCQPIQSPSDAVINPNNEKDRRP